MASQRQIEANRRNAQKSTGPRTQAGRERSRLNALKHGLSRKLPTEGAADPSILPLAQAIAGEGTRDPDALMYAEQIAVESLHLLAIRDLRPRLLANLPAALAERGGALAERGPHPRHPLTDLVQLERYERQALTRRSRALARLTRTVSAEDRAQATRSGDFLALHCKAHPK